MDGDHNQRMLAWPEWRLLLNGKGEANGRPAGAASDLPLPRAAVRSRPRLILPTLQGRIAPPALSSELPPIQGIALAGELPAEVHTFRNEHDLDLGADRMMPAAVPVDTAHTASSASGSRSYAHVVCLGAVPALQADAHLGAPEPEIDFDAAAKTLLAARDVEETTSSMVAPGSPFGI